MKELVQNVPEYAKDYPVWMVTDLRKEGLWYYACFTIDQRDRANELAMELGKVVLVD